MKFIQNSDAAFFSDKYWNCKNVWTNNLRESVTWRSELEKFKIKILQYWISTFTSSMRIFQEFYTLPPPPPSKRILYIFLRFQLYVTNKINEKYGPIRLKFLVTLDFCILNHILNYFHLEKTTFFWNAQWFWFSLLSKLTKNSIKFDHNSLSSSSKNYRHRTRPKMFSLHR